MTNPDPVAQAFEAHRSELVGLAYRMTGTLSDAEDLVQEAFLRLRGAAEPVAHPRAFLHRVVTRLCLDLLKSARHRREVYTGPWLPEPVIEPLEVSAADGVELADELGIALLLALERLSPLERAVFVLREAFDYDFDELAVVLDRSAPAVRQLASRARAHMSEARPRFAAPAAEGRRLVQALLGATVAGDMGALTRVLRDDVVLVSDGGGKVRAALRPILGADKVARFLLGVARKSPLAPGARVVLARVSGLPGVLVFDGDTCLYTVGVAVVDGCVAEIYIVRNPDKLRHVRPPAG